MQTFIGNIRYAFRQFGRSPVFTAAAVLTLSLGIGGTTAIFSLIHSLMLQSLPVTDPAQLYRIGDGNDCCVEGGPQDRWGMYPYPLFLRLKQNLPEFEELAAFQSYPNTISVRRDSEHAARSLHGEFASGNYFSTFGIGAFGGRMFTPNDDDAGAPPVAVMSHHAWQTTYGADPSVVGSTFFIEGKPFTIVGIAPAGFFGETLRSDPADVWIPLQQEPLVRGGGSLLKQSISAWLRVIGRLKPGATTAGMDARLTGLLRNYIINEAGFPAVWLPQLKQALPKQFINVVPAGAGVAAMKEDYGESLKILLAVCALVLLIACANVANLLLARAAERRSQTAIRMAIGASRRQIVAQALSESVLLALLGCAAGLAIAIGASNLLLSLAFHSSHFLPVSSTPSLPALGFAIGLSLLTGILFGTAPAWFATRTNPAEALQGVSRSTRDRSSPMRKVLLVLQATISVVLVAGATMLARSLGNMEHQNFGFAADNRISIEINTPPSGYTPEQLNAMQRNLQARLSAIPGVQQAGIALYNPLTDNWGEGIVIEGRSSESLRDNNASWDRISSTYLKSVGQPVVRGRDFNDADNENSQPVAIVNEAFARKFFPNDNPLEKHFGMDLPKYAGMFRIIGVARDAKYTDVRHETRPMFFLPITQWAKYDEPLMLTVDLRAHFAGGIMLMSSSTAGQLEPQVRQVIGDVDPNISIIDIRSVSEMIDVEFDQERSVASLAGLFGVVALLLAAIGLYGVTAYTVAQRTNEFGIRMALGADRTNVVRLVLRGAFMRIGVGLLIGIPLAIGAGKLLAAQLWGVKAWDPLALGTAAVSLGLCAFAAAVAPAMRAAKTSPMEALRFQ